MTADVEQAAVNTDPPEVRCGMCRGRCAPEPWHSPRWITCVGTCRGWSSHNPRRRGFVWWLRVVVGR